jgi:MEMO1 family protein
MEKYLELCCLVPHAPILVPQIGGLELKRVEDTVSALDEMAERIRGLKPDTIVIVSPPHLSLRQAEGFDIKSGSEVKGSLSRFGAGQVSIRFAVDNELVEAISRSAKQRGVSLVADASTGEQDWGVLVPLALLAPKGCMLASVRVSPYLSYREHYLLGIAIRDGLEKVKRSGVFIASGDMSHRLTEGAPSGYDPSGKKFDKELREIIESGDFEKLFEMDPGLVEAAGEDCLWSAAAMAGTVDGFRFESSVLSYEGPFGVGYMVAYVLPGEPYRNDREKTP